MLNKCAYASTTPLFTCCSCILFLETCSYVVSEDGYALDSECGDYYFCSRCNENYIYKTYINL